LAFHYNFEIELWKKIERVGVGSFSFCRICLKTSWKLLR